MNFNSDILIVDDQRLLADLLEKEGYQVRLAEKPQKAMDSAILKPPGLILLDVSIPGMDSFELCQHLKQDKRTEHVRIIFICSLNDMETVIRGFEAGGVDYISKPFLEQDVLARVKTHMRMHEMQLNFEVLADQPFFKLTKNGASLEQNIKALKKSNEQFRLVFDNLNDTIVVAQDEKIKYCNTRILELSGYSMVEIQSMNFLELIHPDDKEKVLMEYQARLSGEHSKNRYSVRILTKDGLEKFVQVSSALINWDSSPATLALITDITQLKMMEGQLRISENGFRWLMEQSPLAMEILSPDGKINKINRAWRQLWNVSQAEAVEVIDKYNMVTDPQIERLGILDKVKEAFKGKHVILPPIQYDTGQTKVDFDIEILKELRSPWIQCHLNSVKDAAGNIMFVVNTYVDITNLKKTEKKIQEQRDALTRVDRTATMGQLTGSIAHELNQPLTGILSNAQAAEILMDNDARTSEDLREILSSIVSDTKRASSIIRNIRGMYRKSKDETYPFEINKIVNDTVDLLNSEFIAHDLTPITKLTTSLPTVDGNAIQIQQVLVNLIMNAIQAMNQPKPERWLHIVTALKKNEVNVWIEDNGPGIDSDKVDHIFEPLATWKPGGMGMGLSVSNSIIEAHGGRMFVENLSKKGCRVGFILPVTNESNQT